MGVRFTRKNTISRKYRQVGLNGKINSIKKGNENQIRMVIIERDQR